MLKGMTLFIMLLTEVIWYGLRESFRKNIRFRTNKQMSDYCESLKVENESFKSKIEEQESKITDLKQINMRYFERLTMETNQVNESNPVDSISKDESPKDWDSFLNEW